jgi:hypothetical protein
MQILDLRRRPRAADQASDVLIAPKLVRELL